MILKTRPILSAQPLLVQHPRYAVPVLQRRPGLLSSGFVIWLTALNVFYGFEHLLISPLCNCICNLQGPSRSENCSCTCFSIASHCGLNTSATKKSPRILLDDSGCHAPLPRMVRKSMNFRPKPPHQNPQNHRPRKTPSGLGTARALEGRVRRPRRTPPSGTTKSPPKTTIHILVAVGLGSPVYDPPLPIENLESGIGPKRIGTRSRRYNSTWPRRLEMRTRVSDTPKTHSDTCKNTQKTPAKHTKHNQKNKNIFPAQYPHTPDVEHRFQSEIRNQKFGTL